MQEQYGKKAIPWKELGYHFAMEDVTPEVLKRYQSEYPEHSDNLLTLYSELLRAEEYVNSLALPSEQNESGELS